MAEEGFVLARNFSSYYERDFSLRMERLRTKIRKEHEMEHETNTNMKKGKE